jgi:hypothetical protein
MAEMKAERKSRRLTGDTEMRGNVKKTIALLVTYLLVIGLLPVVPIQAQNRTTFGGIRNAIDYAYGIPRAGGVQSPAALIIDNPGSTAAGASATMTLAFGTTTAADGTIFSPLSPGILTPITVGAGTDIETVTPTAISCATPAVYDTCQVTATFTNAHGRGEFVTSGTYGLQEAIDLQNNGGLVIVTPEWQAIGGTNGLITAAIPFQGVGIQDTRFGGIQYWNLTPGGTTVLATPTALTGQAACDATHTFCSDASVAGSASWGGTVYGCITYVDAAGNESLCSTTASFTSVANKAIDIGAPAASAGAVGWKPYLSLSGGTYALAYSIPLLTQPTVLQAVPLSSGVCVLTTLETTTPACALANTTYNQASSTTGAAATLFTKGGAQVTGYPVVTSQLAPNLDSASAQSLNPSNGGLTTYKYAPGNKVGLAGVTSAYTSFPVTTAAQSTIGQVAGTIPLPPGFMNYPGREIEVCGMLSKTSTNASTITNIQLWWDAEGSNVTAGTAVELSNIQITSTNTAAASYSFCQDIQTTVAAATATGSTIQPGMGWITTGQVAAGTVPVGGTNILFAAVGSLNLALNAKLEVVYNHTTGTDGAGVILLNPTVKILN